MKQFTRISLSIYICFVVYTLFILLFGSCGYLSSSDLVSYKSELSGNIEELSGINRDLNIEFNSLYTDTERINLHSRELGYLGENEGKINLVDFSAASRYLSMGRMLKYQNSNYSEKGYYRVIAVIIALFFYLFTTIFKHKRG